MYVYIEEINMFIMYLLDTKLMLLKCFRTSVQRRGIGHHKKKEDWALELSEQNSEDFLDLESLQKRCVAKNEGVSQILNTVKTCKLKYLSYHEN